jgi:hypothetical protein
MLWFFRSHPLRNESVSKWASSIWAAFQLPSPEEAALGNEEAEKEVAMVLWDMSTQ